MNILVLGAGRMGHGAAYDLVHNSPGVEAVTVADFDLKKPSKLRKPSGQRKSAHGGSMPVITRMS